MLSFASRVLRRA